MGWKENFTAGLNRHSLAILWISIAGQIAIYAGMIVRPAYLPNLYNIPLYDILDMIDLDRTTQLRLGGSFLGLAVFYLVGWLAVRRLTGRRIWALVLGGALVAAAVLILVYPFDAADIYDNISHGRILGIYGGNPFQQVSADYPQDVFSAFPAWPHSPSAYGPLWEIMAGLTARLAGDGLLATTVAFKLLPGIFATACVALIAGIFHTEPARALPAVWLLAWNPLVLFETFGQGHNDMVMVAFILGAVWMLDLRHYSLGIIFLVMGGLVKYIPLILIPLAGVVALRGISSLAGRLKFLLVTGSIGIGLILACYAPFWVGVDTLTIDRRANLFTTSLPSIAYHFLAGLLGDSTSAQLVSGVAGLVTMGFALWRADRAGGDPRLGLIQTKPGQLFAGPALETLLFYLFVSVLWFHQWYLTWPLALAALLPISPVWALTLFSGFAVLSKPLLVGPLVFYWLPPQPQPWLELRLSVGVLTLPWLASLMTIWITHKRGKG